MDTRNCPRCGTTLPDDEDGALCPSCGFASGAATEAIEITPEELLAELERRRSRATTHADLEGELEGEVSVITTTPSGLLKAHPPRSSEALRVASTPARWRVIAFGLGLAVALGALVWLTWDLLP